MCRDLLFAGVSVQISAVSVPLSVTDYKCVLLICCDIFNSTFLISNNIWKFKMVSLKAWVPQNMHQESL